MYGIWILSKLAVRRHVPQVLMLQDNMPAIWGTLNLKFHAPFWRRNKGLKALILYLRSSGLVLHSAYVPCALRPADPVSRIAYFFRS